MLVITIGKQEIFLMIVCPEVADPKDAIYWILLIIESLITCLALVHITRLIRVFGKTSLFHKNLVRISQALLIIFYPTVIARVIIAFYEAGVLAHDGSYLSNILISCACLVRLWTTNSMVSYFPSVIIERLFASKYIMDYEKLPRPWICRIVIPFVCVTSIFTSTSEMLGYSNNVAGLILISIFFLIYCTTCITLFRRDSAKLRVMNRNLVQKKVIYTLSTKFQLKENIKVMKILMHQTIVVAVNTVIGCLFFTLTTTVLVNHPQWNPIAYVLSNISFTVSFYLIALVYMVALDEVRIHFLLPWNWKAQKVHGIQPINEHRGASNVYFEQLTNAW
uniref:G protein-coupled receptor n=1 Tax=Haemonchus contortus TaxID=6289 RepID=A0A7I4Y3L8_HAECO